MRSETDWQALVDVHPSIARVLHAHFAGQRLYIPMGKRDSPGKAKLIALLGDNPTATLLGYIGGCFVSVPARRRLTLEENLRRAEEVIADGGTNNDVASALGVCWRQAQRWRSMIRHREKAAAKARGGKKKK